MTEDRSSALPDPSNLSELVDLLSNDNVVWDGTLDGFLPTIVGQPARQLLSIGSGGYDAIPQLIGALEDERKFIAAHVLLTLLSGVQYDLTPWNGLKVDLSHDGLARFDVSQRVDLARRWHAWQMAQPHPQSLPE